MNLERTTRLFVAGRIAAILAMAVLFAGKTVHQHQECGDCCDSGSCSVPADDRSSATSCPFGCTDCETSKSEHQPDSDGTPEHEEHSCAVCSVLAASPDQVELVLLPDEAPFVAGTVAQSSESPAEGHLLAEQSRGPPFTA